MTASKERYAGTSMIAALNHKAIQQSDRGIPIMGSKHESHSRGAGPPMNNQMIVKQP